MFNASLLKSEMVKKGITTTAICNKLGINEASFYRKLNGKSEFKRNELNLLKNLLSLSVDEMDAIFFAK